MNRFKLGIYLCLFFIPFLLSCSNDEGNLLNPKYLLSEINRHDAVTDDITYVDEYVYDSDDNLILIKGFRTRNLSEIDRVLFKYNELNELTSIRHEGGGSFYELQVTKDNGEVTVKGWDQPHKVVFHYNEDNMITSKEVWYNNSMPNIFNFTYNNQRQMVEFEQNIGSLAPKIVKFDNYVDSNLFPFPVYIGTFGELEFIITHSFNLKLGENGVPTTSSGNVEFSKFEYDIDKHKNISKMYLNFNNIFSFKYKRAD